MTNREKAIQFIHESAERLRRIASLQAFLAPQLLEMARGLDEQADELGATSNQTMPLAEVRTRSSRISG
jgi:hypothetical protein